jgi:Maltose acetyltransferase
MTRMKERMLRGELYLAADPALTAELARAQELLERYTRHLTRRAGAAADRRTGPPDRSDPLITV